MKARSKKVKPHRKEERVQNKKLIEPDMPMEKPKRKEGKERGRGRDR
jgi:hypothetical protein